LEAQQKEMAAHAEELESKLTQAKEQLYKAQKEKEHTVIQLNNKIEILQYKLLNSGGSEIAPANNMESTFKELLVLCQGDLAEITSRLNQISQSEANEDMLRKEIIEQGRLMNELRDQHERQCYELSKAHDEKLQ
jgi:hypothetical protein